MTAPRIPRVTVTPDVRAGQETMHTLSIGNLTRDEVVALRQFLIAARAYPILGTIPVTLEQQGY